MSLMLTAAVLTETTEAHPDPAVAFIAAGIAFAAFLLFGVVTWSYRDVANRTTRGRTTATSADHDAAGNHNSHAGH